MKNYFPMSITWHCHYLKKANLAHFGPLTSQRRWWKSFPSLTGSALMTWEDKHHFPHTHQHRAVILIDFPSTVHFEKQNFLGTASLRPMQRIIIIALCFAPWRGTYTTDFSWVTQFLWTVPMVRWKSSASYFCFKSHRLRPALELRLKCMIKSCPE